MRACRPHPVVRTEAGDGRVAVVARRAKALRGRGAAGRGGVRVGAAGRARSVAGGALVEPDLAGCQKNTDRARICVSRHSFQ